ncbi:MAG: hypothetical protein KJN76_05170 [Eudoraea sp.]|nr:hypothetical protein [Eudoraea sp.]
MKFAPYSVIILLLCIVVFSCKNGDETRQETLPATEVEAPPAVKTEKKKELSPKLNTIPKEQKSDRRIQNKKKKNALDTLRPKTA